MAILIFVFFAFSVFLCDQPGWIVSNVKILLRAAWAADNF
jgi:hypothetical protein